VSSSAESISGSHAKPLEEVSSNFTSKAKALNILRSFPIGLLLFFFAAISAWAVDPSRHISQYAHSAWRIQDGVFSGTPKAVAQTTDGYLWIGTTSGLVRFDGVRFVPWVPPEGQQLPSSRINSLLGTPDGSLWVGTGVGLSRWRDNQLTNYSTERGIVTAVVQARDETIWIELSDPTGKTGPLCQIIGTGMRCQGKDDGIPADIYTPMAEDRQGNFWLGGGTTLVGWKWNSHLVYKPRGLKSNAGGGIDGLAADPDGSLWVGIARSGPGLGLQHLRQGIWKPFRTPELDGSTMAVATLLLDRENALWVGTPEHGLYRIYGGKVEHFGSADGLSGDHVVRCFEDREGDLWVLTSKGIDSFRDMRIASFSTREGLGMEEVDSVLASRNGAIWIGGTDSLDAIYHDRISSITHGKGLPGHQVTSLFEDHVGRLWVGLDDGLTVYENGEFHRVKRRNGSSRGLIVGIAEDVDHNIWVETGGQDRSLIRIQDLQVREEFSVPRMPAARRVAADPGGGLWLGLMNGDLARYQHGRTETFHFQHVPDSRVEQVTVNPDGSVLGATAFGVIGWRHGKQLTLTTRNGLPCNSVYAFVSDQRGNLWLNTQCALVKITNQDLQKWWQDPDVVVQPSVFDVLDGAQPDWVPFAAAARSPDGRLWFADSNRLQMIDPNHLAENPIPPPVHVEQVIADRKNYSPRQDLRLPPHTRDLEIDYTALSFVAPQKVRFRYKLEGRDTTWQEPGTRRQAFYNDLRPGRYRFRVIACNNDGVWNDAGATLNFSVAPAWYQTVWFRILCIVFGVCIVVVLYRLRVRQIARAIGTRFDERLAERTRMARDLHDTFLQTIQGSKLAADDALDEPSDPVRMRRAIEKLSEWLGQATQEGRAALNSLRTSTTQANDLAQALQRATEDGPILGSMAVNFTVLGDPQMMHPIVRDEIYRIGYEAIRNAHVHSSASHLEVELSYGQDLSLRVADNGVGIDSDVADQGKVGHFGLQGMRERAARIGAKLTLASSSALGTEIKLVVPGGIIFQKTGTVRQTLLAKIRALISRTNQPSKLD
jgi:signal transduction histidine kinase/ligand-binding sensor domain-containing protein